MGVSFLIKWDHFPHLMGVSILVRWELLIFVYFLSSLSGNKLRKK
ncbi:hypothetical protein HMPREF0202_03001 [Cetobacterium somerae ATCC BAA-474]|uniref:Uncharacterized protein n=1 Tax=Cetobacterium somerae ATCC BAA-474 TaxID=1319815 RepID=U7UWC2_9FUSO|nr:hypothetical protein HMPREF0202_03001 [Cetobacterium somerae ATCC BAA-474]